MLRRGSGKHRCNGNDDRPYRQEKYLDGIPRKVEHDKGKREGRRGLLFLYIYDVLGGNGVKYYCRKGYLRDTRKSVCFFYLHYNKRNF